MAPVKTIRMRRIQDTSTLCSPLKSFSLIPDSLTRVVKNLRLWGVFCSSSERVIFHAVKRSDCERFLKSVPAFASAGFYIVRFDSAY